MAHNALISKDIVNNLQSDSPKGNSLFFQIIKKLPPTSNFLYDLKQIWNIHRIFVTNRLGMFWF